MTTQPDDYSLHVTILQIGTEQQRLENLRRQEVDVQPLVSGMAEPDHSSFDFTAGFCSAYTPKNPPPLQ